MMHPSKVAGVMVMLASALQRPHADNKARETKVETSVALQQEVKIELNFQPIESFKVKPTQLPANCVLYIICLLNQNPISGGASQRLFHRSVSCSLPTGGDHLTLYHCNCIC